MNFKFLVTSVTNYVESTEICLELHDHDKQRQLGLRPIGTFRLSIPKGTPVTVNPGDYYDLKPGDAPEAV